MTKARGHRGGALLRGLVALVLLTLSPLAAQKVTALQGHANIVWSVAFSPDGQRLASASQDPPVKVWGVQPHKAPKKP